MWTVIHRAGAADQTALEDFAARYREPVAAYLARKGLARDDAEDVCHDVFLRVLQGGVLTRANPDRGRFRSLLLTVATRVAIDRSRKRTVPVLDDLEPVEHEPDFDQAWALHLTERAIARLREQNSRYYEVLAAHLDGERQDRQKLWIARRKLAALVRREVAMTCATERDFEEELAYLARYLRPRNRQQGGE